MATGWLWLVGSFKLYVSFAKEPYKRDDVLQKKTYNFKEPTTRSHPTHTLGYEGVAPGCLFTFHSCGVLHCVAVLWEGGARLPAPSLTVVVVCRIVSQ